jgi:hypothetical protein
LLKRKTRAYQRIQSVRIEGRSTLRPRPKNRRKSLEKVGRSAGMPLPGVGAASGSSPA